MDGGLEGERVGWDVAGGLGIAMATWVMDFESAKSWIGSLPSCSSLRWGWRWIDGLAVGLGDAEIRGRLACVWR